MSDEGREINMSVIHNQLNHINKQLETIACSMQSKEICQMVREDFERDLRKVEKDSDDTKSRLTKIAVTVGTISGSVGLITAIVMYGIQNGMFSK